MHESYAASQQSRIDPAEVARINALPQGSKPVRSTVINDNGKITRISTDQSGQVTITKSTDRVVVPSADVAPAHPLAPGETYTLAPGGGFASGGPNGRIPGEAANVAYAFFLMIAVIVVGWPLARAFARRIERRGEAAASLNPAVAEQLVRIEQAVEAMAIEVERISESQRFVAKLQRESSAERV